MNSPQPKIVHEETFADFHRVTWPCRRTLTNGSDACLTSRVTSIQISAVSLYWRKALAKRSSQLKPTRAKFTTSMELGIVWTTTWFELARVGSSWLSANSNQVFHRLATSANSSQLSQVVLLLLCDYVVVFRQLNGFLRAGSTWWYRLATRQCKFWFCNLARVGLSWEYRRASETVACEQLSGPLRGIGVAYWSVGPYHISDVVPHGWVRGQESRVLLRSGPAGRSLPDRAQHFRDQLAAQAWGESYPAPSPQVPLRPAPVRFWLGPQLHGEQDVPSPFPHRLRHLQLYLLGTHIAMRYLFSLLLPVVTTGDLNPFTPKLKKYILPTFSREMYKWGSENWYKNHLSIWVSYEKSSSSYRVM